MYTYISSVGDHRPVGQWSTLKIFRKIYQDIQLDEGNIEFSIRDRSRPCSVRDPKIFLGHDPSSIATLKTFWVATSTEPSSPTHYRFVT